MDNLTLIEAGEIEDSRKPIIRLVLIMAAILIMILPFVTTFNEFLTSIVETTGLDVLLTDWVVPIEARMLAVILGSLPRSQAQPSTWTKADSSCRSISPGTAWDGSLSSYLQSP